MEILQKLSVQTKSLLIIILGIILLLDRFGWFHELLKNLIFIGALCLIAYGLILGKFPAKIAQLIQDRKKN